MTWPRRRRTTRAAKLTGRQIDNEITTTEAALAKADGVVVVFGASDDLMEFRGAIYDEFGCYDGGTARVGSAVLVPSWDNVDHGDENACQAYFASKVGACEITAVWSEGATDPEAAAWTYKTDIPHSTFDIMEDGEVYCRGIVFAMADLA